jgi:hypothetical protein
VSAADNNGRGCESEGRLFGEKKSSRRGAGRVRSQHKRAGSGKGVMAPVRLWGRSCCVSALGALRLCGFAAAAAADSRLEAQHH